MTKDEVRQRSEELLAKAEATLAAPRPVYDDLWKAPEPEMMRRPAPAQPPRPSAPPVVSRAYVQARIADAIDALVKGTAEFVAGQRRLSEMRAAESERRLAELERRVADLERR